MRQYLNYAGETIYIAGPACFYYDGYALWHAQRKKAEYYGFKVVMPTTNALDLTHSDPRENADAIFRNCAAAMNESTAIIADLESFRGTEPDGGTLFEMGMAYARGARLYAYTRDKRPMLHKTRAALLKGGRVTDEAGRPIPYFELPFCPCLTASAEIIEGGFDDALQLLMIGVEREKCAAGWPSPVDKMPEAKQKTNGKTVFLFSPRLYFEGAKEWYEQQKTAFLRAGLTLLSPLDPLKGEPDGEPADPLSRAGRHFERWKRQTDACDLFYADLNDFNGPEPSGDVAFLAGYAWQKGKKCLGFMRNTEKMRDKIPHYGAEADFKDQFGNDVENFDYPINLMFASSMPIFAGEPCPGTAADFLGNH